MSSNNYSGPETFVSVNPKDPHPYSRNSGPPSSQNPSHSRQHPYGHSSSAQLPSPAALFGAAPSGFPAQQPSGYPPAYSPYSSQPYPSSRPTYQQYHQYPPSGLQPLSIGRPTEFSRSQYPSPDSPGGPKTVCVLPPPNGLPPLSELPPNDHQIRGEVPAFLPSLGKPSFMALSPINNLQIPEGNPSSDPAGPGNQNHNPNSHHILYSQYEYKNPSTTMKREREREIQTSVTDQEKIHSRKKSRGSFSSQMPLYTTKVVTSPPAQFSSSPPETPPSSGHYGTDIHRGHKGSNVLMTFAGLSSPPATPQVELSPRARSHDSPISESSLRDHPYRCDDCGRSYSILMDLHEHKWEHSQSWKEVEKMVDLSKQQQVQIMEAAQILIEMASMSVKA